MNWEGRGRNRGCSDILLQHLQRWKEETQQKPEPGWSVSGQAVNPGITKCEVLAKVTENVGINKKATNKKMK